MIPISFISLVWTLISIFPILVLSLWMIYTIKKEERIKIGEGIEQCPVCTYIFLNHGNRAQLQLCPRCQSLIEG